MGQRLAVEQMLSRSASAAPAGASNAAPPQLSRTPPIQSTIAAEPWRVARGAAQAASSKRVESEKSSLLRQRQQEAVKKVFEARRKAQAAAVAAPKPRAAAPRTPPPPARPRAPSGPPAVSPFFTFTAATAASRPTSGSPATSHVANIYINKLTK